MTFDWSEYLKLAQELAGNDVGPVNQEAKLRSSISRAYYASFCKTRNYLRDIEGDTTIPQTGDAHIYVKDNFIDSSDIVRRRIGCNLNRLRVRRTKVDYKDFVRGLPSMVIASLNSAQIVISSLNNL